MLAGRETTVASVVAVLRSDGRVVVVGTGGVGKTTLAGHVVAQLAPEQIVWVDLERPGPRPSVEALLIDEIGGPRLAGDAHDTRLHAVTEGRRVAVVLDGADADIDEAVMLTRSIPTTPDGPWVVITSRVHPGTVSIPVVRLLPFDLTPGADWQTALDLFRSWYLRAGGDARSVDDRVDVVTRLLTLTSGIPLAIRVAAAAAAATGLDAAESLLATGDGAEELTTCIDRSVQVLTSPERLVFDSIGVTAGWVDVDVTMAISGLDRNDATATLGSLVRHNLIEPEADGYRMLPPVHRFAVAHVDETDELWDKCRDWCRSMGEDEARLSRHAQDLHLVVGRLLQSADVEDVIDAAELTRALARSQFAALLQHAAVEQLSGVLASAALHGADLVDQRIELLRLLAIALAESDGVDAALSALDEADRLVHSAIDPARASARLVSLRATFLHDAGAINDALQLIRSAGAAAREFGDRFNEVQSRLHEATMLLDLGELVDADEIAAAVIDACDDSMAALAQTAWSTRAMAAVERGDRAGCEAIARRQLREARSLGEAIDAEYLLMLADPIAQSSRLVATHRIDRSRPGEWMVYLEAQASLATQALIAGEHDLALTMASDIAVVAEVVPLFWMRLEGLLLIGDAALVSGDRRQAWLAYRHALTLANVHGCVTRAADAVDGLARLTMAGDRRRHAFGAAALLRAACEADRRPRPWLPELPVARSRSRSQVAEGWIHGSRLTDTAIDIIVAAATAQSGGIESGLGRLSPAEVRVSRLVAQGCTNREIGERLHIARRTVETHIVHAFQKLGVQNRTQLATYVTTSEADNANA